MYTDSGTSRAVRFTGNGGRLIVDIYELEKQATPGPLVVGQKRDTYYTVHGCGATIGHFESLVDRDQVSEHSFRTKVEEARANAALLAHCRNHFMEALQLLKDFWPVVEHAGHEDDMARYKAEIAKLEDVKEVN